MNRRVPGSVFALALLLALAACGGGAPPAPPVTQTVGASGGTVTGPSGASVVIPPGALAQDTPIGIAQTNAGAPALPGGTSSLGATFAFTPHGTVFAKPVTITVPFDPGQLPAGSRPVLLKTNAAMNGWDAVAGSNVNGGIVTAQVTGFSFATVVPEGGLLRGEPRRDWEFKAFMGDGKLVSVKDPPPQTGGPVDDTLNYNGGGIGNVHSTADAKTYWAFASSPKGSILDASSQIGNQVWLNHYQTFTKVDDNATLKLTITAVTLNAFEIAPGDIFPYECVVKPECDLYVYAWASFWVSVYGLDRDGKYWSFYASGAATMSDRGINPSQTTPCKRDWKVDYGIWGGRVPDNLITPLWDKDDFEEAPTPNNCGYTVKLKKPITIFINLSKVEVGHDFVLESDVLTSTFNEAGGEGGLFAYFRDPVNPVGGTLEYTGLQPSSNLPPQRQPPEPLPACQTAPDPAAGTLAWSAASYDQKEVPVSRNPVTITRTGGSKGAVSVRVTSSDGTALAGQDYSPVNTTVTFADGDATPRVIEVPITTDAVPEGNKSLTLTLSDPRGCAALGTPRTATLNILDNDRIIQIPTFTVGGTVSGLAGTGLVLEDRARFLDFKPTGNGSFTFTLPYRVNETYDVRVKTQPSNPIQTCSVTNGTGTVSNANVTNVLVNCVTQGQNPALDPTFGSGGKAFLTGPTEAMALQPDGKIVMGGGTIGSFRLTRINNNGSLDTGFGAGGTVNTDFPGTVGTLDDNAHAIAVQPDGKIVAVGEAVNGFISGLKLFNRDFALARYNPDGSLDGSFGNGGLVTTEFNGFTDRAYAVAIQPDGKIVVAGDIGVSTTVGADFGVARYNPDGSLDSSFDGDGKVTMDIVGGIDLARLVALQPDGKIVVAGPFTTKGSSGLDHTGLVRLNADGSLDTGFGSSGNGRVTLMNTGVSDDMVLQPDGKIVLGGSVFAGASQNYDFLIVRLNSSGSLDTGFGSGGRVTTDVGPFTDAVNALAVQADGKIIAAGGVSLGTAAGGDFALARYDANGSPDTGFDGDGKLTVDFFGSSDSASGVAIQPDGKIIVGGSVRNGSSGGIGLARINP